MKKIKQSRFLAAALVGALTASVAMAQDAAGQGPSTLSETYDAWTVQCVNRVQDGNAQRTCQMSQELLQQNTRQRVLTFAVSREGGAARATLILPFGLLLADGMRVTIEEEDVLSGTFRTCLPAGCLVELDLSEDAIAKLESATTASIEMTANSGQPVKTDVSLQGFASAFQRLTALVSG
jgi:invasion protein IalB